MSRLKKEIRPDFSEGIDRKQLKQVRDRFLQVNAERLDRARQAIQARHRDILELLPLLYHLNHPLLPGFVSRDTPSGLSLYSPAKTTISLARSFSQTFRYKAEKRQQCAIHSIFMMGSSGTLAHSESSDVDLWLCHDPELDASSLEKLKQKALKLDEWANDLGLELHTFLMNAKAFREQKSELEVDAESSGSAQHFLLLDEFYRTAILLAGRYPLWWLIPDYLESEYALTTERMLSQRFIKESEVIDFGSVAHIPESELVGAGLWQLYKSLDAPYKSVLKLLLIEVYAQELPERACLSLSFKAAVYRDELELEKLDPYYLIYQRLEQYLLANNEVKRLDLVRKSFYLKVNQALSKPSSKRSVSWQRACMDKLVRDWAWPERYFRQLDQRRNWRIEDVLLERQQLLTELTQSYRFLSNYARANNIASSITAADLTLLGRKLYAIFQRKAGKIEKVNPGIAPNIWEENLALHHSSSQSLKTDDSGQENVWLLYRDLAAGDDPLYHPTLRKSASLLELLSWLHFNGIVNADTRLSLNPGSSGVKMQELKALLGSLARTLKVPLQAVSQNEFMRPAYVKDLLLYINVGCDPMGSLSEPGLLRLSEQNDSLRYSSQRYNLVKTIDQVALNSWNELSTGRYELGETLLQNLQAYLLMCQAQLTEVACRLHVFCFASQRADAIAKRVKDLFESAREAFIVNGAVQTTRYVLNIEDSFYLIQSIDEQFRYQNIGDERALEAFLARPVSSFSPVVFDPYCFSTENLLSYAASRALPQHLQVFYHIGPKKLSLCIVDEVGSVLSEQLPAIQEELFLASLVQFLRNLAERRQLDQNLVGAADIPELKLYKVAVQQSGRLESRAVKIPEPRASYQVAVTAYFDAMQLQYDLSYEGRDFTFTEHGEHKEQALLHFIRSQAQYDSRLPVMVSDVSYPSDPILMRNSGGGMRSYLDYLSVYLEVESRFRILQS